MGVRTIIKHAAGLAIAVTLLAGPTSASGAVRVGETFDAVTPCAADFTRLQAVSPDFANYTVPTDGVLTAWSFASGPAPAPTLKFKVGRRVTDFNPDGSADFLIVGESLLKSPPADSSTTYTDLRLPVRAGDVIGMYIQDAGNCASFGDAYRNLFNDSDVPPQATEHFLPENVKNSISALLEPDADCDSFGDESQDPFVDPNGCNPPAPEPLPGDGNPPTAMITKAPKDKTKKKTATFEFTGADTRAVASFQCSLDGAAFAACTSPFTAKVKKGKHNFQVRAIDEVGNTGPPATDDWKVKKKKRR